MLTCRKCLVFLQKLPGDADLAYVVEYGGKPLAVPMGIRVLRLDGVGRAMTVWGYETFAMEAAALAWKRLLRQAGKGVKG
jgi:hypothetical protein